MSRVCQRRTVRGVTNRGSYERRWLLTIRSSAAMTALSLQENRGRGLLRCAIAS